MWNETDIPLAYLITFRTYGTRLHGDDRGSVDRFQNTYGTPRIPHKPHRQQYNKDIRKGEAVLLDAPRRIATDEAIKEVCEHRGWKLWAINVRINHGHVVTTIGPRKPHLALNAFKAYATRKMREGGFWIEDYSPWSDKGSERWLWTEQSIFYACDYVINGQGSDLTEFDNWRK